MLLAMVPTRSPIPAGFVIGAGRISDPWPVAKAISRIEWNEAKGGAAYILLTGRIFYKTIFGGAGETGFCFEYNWERESFVMSPNDKLNYYR
jgi:hypothetical protein